MSFPSSPVKLFDWGVLDTLVHLPPVLDDIKRRTDVGVPLWNQGHPVQPRSFSQMINQDECVRRRATRLPSIPNVPVDTALVVPLRPCSLVLRLVRSRL